MIKKIREDNKTTFCDKSMEGGTGSILWPHRMSANIGGAPIPRFSNMSAKKKIFTPSLIQAELRKRERFNIKLMP